jgi:hypothetical protein
VSETSPAQTRRAWHGVAELVMAGPQYRRTGTIRLRRTSGGFGTTTAPDLRVDNDRLVAGDASYPLNGATCVELAAAAGVDVGAPADLYKDGSGVGPDEPLVIDPAVAALLAACFAIGEEAMRHLLPDLTPVLWPEHFDLAVTADAANYGVSPGDGYLDEPYAYVGPFQVPTGPFWNAPFGAAHPLRELPTAAAVAAFFGEGRGLLA